MSTRIRMLLVAGLVAVFGFAGGSAFAQSEDLPVDAPEDCVENVMDLPALNVCKDAQGRHLLDLPAIGRDWEDRFVVHDEVTGEDWTWGAHNYVRLDPFHEPAHILTVRSTHPR